MAPPGVRAQSRRRYSRAELEALRFLDLENQQQWWKDVYDGLSPDVSCEYEAVQRQPGSGRRKEKNRRDKKQTDATLSKQHFEETSTCVGEKHLEEIATASAREQLMEETAVNDVGKLPEEDARIGSCVHSLEETSNPIVEEVELENKDEYCDDSHDEELETIQQPALFVDGEPDFASGPPLDGIEYLRRVRWEASQLPKVTVAKIDSSKIISEQTAYIPIIQEIPERPLNLLPSKEWEDDFLAEFSKMRQAFSELASSLDQSSGDNTETACSISNSMQRLNLNPAMTSSNSKIPDFWQWLNISPTMTVSLGMNNSTTGSSFKNSILGPRPKNFPTVTPCFVVDDTSMYIHKLSNFEQWPKDSPTITALLAMDPTTRAATLRSCVDLFEDSDSISRDQAVWLYALCAAVDAPLLAETSASVRCLLRKCSSLLAGKSEHDDEVAMLNILVAIAGKHFGQSEK